jgi:hypothetical protein
VAGKPAARGIPGSPQPCPANGSPRESAWVLDTADTPARRRRTPAASAPPQATDARPGRARWRAIGPRAQRHGARCAGCRFFGCWRGSSSRALRHVDRPPRPRRGHSSGPRVTSS